MQSIRRPEPLTRLAAMTIEPPGQQPLGRMLHEMREVARPTMEAVDGRRTILLIVRWGIPGALVLAGLVILVAGSGSSMALEGASLFAGAGIAVLLLNLIYRYGATGDRDREREEAARRYFDEHGRWPDEGPGRT